MNLIRRPLLASVTLFSPVAAITASLSMPASASPAAHGDTLTTLKWNPNPETNIAGYRVYLRTAGGKDNSVHVVTKGTRLTLTDLKRSTKYYCSVQAYNTSGLRSVKSREIVFTPKRAPGKGQSGKRQSKPTTRSALVESLMSASKAPTSQQPLRSIVRIDGQKHRSITIPKPSDLHQSSVEVSSNLVDWFSGPKYTDILTDNSEWLTVVDRTPLTPGTKRHIRIRRSR